MPKYKITYSEDLPDGVGGRCFYPFPYLFGLGTCEIIIRPKYKDDIGVHKHELEHARQYTSNWCHAISYAIDAEYRYKCELEAYTEQIKEYKYKSVKECSWIIEALATKYNLNIGKAKIALDIIKLYETRGK